MPRIKKSSTKKPVAKRAAAKKTVAKRAVAKKAPAKKATVLKQALTKTQLYTLLAEAADASKKQVSAIFEEFSALLERSIKKNAVGHFTIPGLCKVVTVRKPATKARKGINPFTKEPTVFKAKPARTVVKIRALKKLKDMV
ncbi:MAG: HU family DNA-binding protein [Gammaproteobacteria bacterium]